MTEYGFKSNATLSIVLTFLEDNKISSSRIVNIYHDGSNHVAVYTTKI